MYTINIELTFKEADVAFMTAWKDIRSCNALEACDACNARETLLTKLRAAGHLTNYPIAVRGADAQ